MSDPVTDPRGIGNPGGRARGRADAFAREWSIEATRPKLTEVEALRGILRPAIPVYLSAVPTQSSDEQIATAAQVQAAGFDPVPHLAARRHGDRRSLEQFLHALREKAGVHRLLVIGGDIDQPMGAFADALQVIESGLLQEAGVKEIGIAGYPEGHPWIAPAELEQALAAKIEAATRARIRVHIVSQFCLEPARIVAWLLRLRRAGVNVPVKVGMVGPTSIATLLKFASRCGVNASARGLMQRPGLLGTLVGDSGPQPVLDALLNAPVELGEISPHFYSFGGVVKTARYAHAAAARGFASDEAAVCQGRG